jgi:hypothetical protein
MGQAMRRLVTKHWWRILAIWAVLTAVLSYVIYVRVKPMYESSSLLRVEPATTDLYGLGTETEAFGQFLQTQVELIRSPAVVSSAIASNPKAAATALLRESRDPEGELRGRLQVGVLGGTYLIRVGLTTSDPNDGPIIINEVVKAYLAVATAWSNEKNRFQISRLEKYSLELSGRIDEKRDEWIQLAQKREGPDEVRLTLVREDLNKFREMWWSVEKRIEQLKFDSLGAARINEIDPARPNPIPIRDNRQMLFAVTPGVVLPLVLILFLGVELLSGRVANRDNMASSA